MPKLYEYLGIVVLFYSDDHKPIHVHGKYQGRENKAEISVTDGQVVDVRVRKVGNKPQLPPTQKADFEKLVWHYAAEIVQTPQAKIDFFVLHQPVEARKITRRIK